MLDRCEKLINAAQKNGADAVEVAISKSDETSVAVRLGALEHVEHSDNAAVMLRVFIGKKQAAISSNDLSDQAMKKMVSRAMDMVRVVPDDPYIGLANTSQLITHVPSLDVCDLPLTDVSWLAEQAKEVEAVARGHKGITNSEGGEAASHHGTYYLATSEGFSQQYQKTHYSLSASVIAGQGTDMQRDYAYSTRCYRNDLKSAVEIGDEAATRTLERLGAKKGPKGNVPVVFSPRSARSLLGYFSSAINGHAIARGTSFLKSSLDKAIFSPDIHIIDDPLRPRGLASRPFDGDGLASLPISFIENGILKDWVLDLRSARQLGLKSNGRAAGSGAGVSNLYLQAGKQSPEELIGQIDSGLYITEHFGTGVNLITGDYSQGVGGMWIEKGKLSYPVNEMTISGHLSDIFSTLVAANDLSFDTQINSPTILVPSLAVA